MRVDEAEEEMMNTLIKEWTAKIEYLIASADKADDEQKIKYLAYIDSLRARQRNLLEILQVLHCSQDLP